MIYIMGIGTFVVVMTGLLGFWATIELFQKKITGTNIVLAVVGFHGSLIGCVTAFLLSDCMNKPIGSKKTKKRFGKHKKV